jgi:outer membrane receptor protein involved in Fe transport
MKTQIPYKFALALALMPGLPASLLAQTTPAPAAGDQPVVLEKFTVNTDRDQGYVAVDSLAGGRQNSPIRVTPASMSSLTAQFIADLNITDLNDALKWSLNTVPTTDRGGFTGGTGGDVFNYWSISSRGGQSVQGGNPPTKNYFPLYVIVDMYNVDRIEFDQGPNSILFGIGDIGGAVSSYTKTARFDKNFQNINAQVTSHGGYRGTIDINQSQGNFAMRLNAVGANEKGWRDGDNNKKMGATLTSTWKFNQENSSIRFEIEGWKQRKNIYTASYVDRASLWNGTTVANTWGETVAGAGDNPLQVQGAPGVQGMSDWGLNPYPVLVAGSNKIVDWSKGIRSMGTQSVGVGAILRPDTFSFNGQTIMALPSREFAIAPSDAYLKPEQMNMTLTFNHRFDEHWDLEVAGYYYVDAQYAKNYEAASQANYDLNKQQPDGSPNPNFGKLYSDFFLNKQVQNHWVKEIRSQLSYRFDANPFNVPLKQVFSVSAGQQATEYDARQYNAQDISTDATPWNEANTGQKLVWGRMYWDQPQASFNAEENGVRYTAWPTNWYDFDSRQTIKFGAFYSQSRLWDDRLSITGGIRRDEYEVTKVGLRGPVNNPVNGEGAGNTYSIGAIGYVTEWLGLIVNKSKNYQPAAGGLAPSLFGEIRGASFGEGDNYGVRISTKDSKYYAQVTYYESEATDVIGGDSPGFQGIWEEYIRAGGTKRDIGPAGQIVGTSAAMQYTTVYDVAYEGWEFELVANPTKNLRLQVHYAKPEGQKTNNGLEGVEYYAQHIADWRAVASATGTTQQQQLHATLNQAETNMAIWANPTLAAGVPRDHWNAFATYTFTDGALQGWDFGFGATHAGARQVTQTNSTTAFTTYSGLIGYTTKHQFFGRRMNTRYQLNIDNMFGEDLLVYRTFDSFDYNFVPPRRFTLSVALGF